VKILDVGCGANKYEGAIGLDNNPRTAADVIHDLGDIPYPFADDEFDADVEAYVAQLAKKSASALSLSKNLLYHMDGMTFETALEAGVQLNAITRMTEDCRRGVEKFLKK
jgi:methylglutaconyl-CoA hydratase